ncbi:MAG: hormogonium polysaccharide biosynthesis protein HpsA, partial [Cyanobacteria bacterium]|nr:hormogonium polysaccharide biosynthesis protein HpsA [Cyanobacteriota bacterium]MDW8200668.1 hormogonium polysaccharide biosynthesis protein HpsA [Cyanobacteriota bacterium SKYGB_h_bin112]
GVVYNINPATDLTAASFAANTTIPAAALPDASGNNGLFGQGTEGYRNERSTTLLGKLYYQANLVYPNGRFVNEPLRRALYALGTDPQKRLTLSEQAAIDAAICSLRILGDPTVTTTVPTPSATPVIPHGAIKEVTMLDPRQPKAIDGRFIRVQSASATASTGTGTAQTYTITYTIPPNFRPNWNGLANATLDDGSPGDTQLSEIFDPNDTPGGDVVTVQGFESVNPLLNAHRGVITAIDDTAGTITVRVRGNNPAAIPNTPAPNATAGITDTSTSELDMPLEDRQPSEIRVTQLDLNLLRTTELFNAGGAPYDPREFMIPNSGLIYVSRDDSLPDLSDVSSTNANTNRILSPVDYRVDPTRRIGGVMLINGNRIDRINQYRDVEKGLIVATNLAGYVQADSRFDGGGNPIGDFNLHADPNTRVAQQEFTVALAADWSNFYTRTVAQINNNFACRPGGLNALCTNGDSWRSAVLLADSFSPLSRNYRLGYRSDGSFDLNNNEDTWVSRAKRLRNGFFTNAFAINGLSGAAQDNADPFNDHFYTNNNAGAVGSTYFNNYVTPVQRRSEDAANASFPAYVMEICRKLPVSECTPSDWGMGYDLNGDRDVQDRLQDMRQSIGGVVPDALVDILQAGNLEFRERDIKPYQLGRILTDMAGRTDVNTSGALEFRDGGPNDEARWDVAYNTAGNNFSPMDRLGAGTTGRPALELGDRRFARRVAFARDQQGKLVFSRSEDANDNNSLDAGEDRNRNGALDRAVNVKPIGVGCPLNIDTTPTALSLLGCYYRDTASNWGDPGVLENGIYYGRPGVTRNNLFFRTTDNRTGNPGNLADVSYRGDRPLYIMGEAQGGNISALPPTPEIPGVRSLNLPAGNRASSYSLCTNDNAADGGSSRKPVLTGLGQTELGRCNAQPGDPMQAIANFQADVMALDDTVSATDNIVSPTITGLGLGTAATPGNDTTTITTNPPPSPVPNQPVVNLIKLGVLLPSSEFPTSTTCKKIKLVGGANDVFIFRSGGGGALNFGAAAGNNTHCGLQVELDGVDPNNVFWVTDKNVQFNQVGAAENRRHRIVGTFVAQGTSNPKWLTVDFYGRFLGSNGKPSAPNFGNASITAVSSDAQPLLVPVLQYTATKDDPNNNIRPSDKNWSGDNDDAGAANRWRQVAPNVGEIYNLVVAVGNNPARTAPRVEGDGGIGNFPRFLEHWNGFPLTINGGLIQIKRSAFATSGDRLLFNEGNFTNPSNWTTFGYFQAYKTGNSPIGNQWGINASYQPPNRLFGFDPGILSQLPDLFTEQFSVPEPVRNEFFQQLDRSDRWVQALLCATQPGDDPNTPRAIVGDKNSTDPAVRRGYFQRVGIANADTGDIPYRFPAIPVNNPFRPRNSPFCPAAFTQYPSTCTATGTTQCNP